MRFFEPLAHFGFAPHCMNLPSQHDPKNMDSAAIKLDLVQRRLAIRDTAILDRVREVMDTEVEDSDNSAEELDELGSLRAERLRGEGSSYSWDEVQRMAREMIKK